jgi:hypothetical protein
MARVRGSHAAARRHSSPLGLVVAAFPRFVRWGLWSLRSRKFIVSNPHTRIGVRPAGWSPDSPLAEPAGRCSGENGSVFMCNSREHWGSSLILRE